MFSGFLETGIPLSHESCCIFPVFLIQCLVVNVCCLLQCSERPSAAPGVRRIQATPSILFLKSPFLYSTPKFFRWSLSLRFSDCTLHAFLTSHVPAATIANLLCLDHCNNTQWSTQVMRRFVPFSEVVCQFFLLVTVPIFSSAPFS
jgi:hypothetical protein